MPTPLDLAYTVAAAGSAPWWRRKARGGWPERFGRVAPGAVPPKGDRPRVLLHGVSVGEVAALRTLVPLLLEDHEVVVAATTDTGIARARELYADRCPVVRYPLDASWAVRRFLDAVRPDAVALTELELWPQFVAACSTRSIPVCVINGRLSARSFRGYRRARPLLRRTFARLSAVGAQDETIAQRFREMGAPDVRVTGSMKWDNAAAPPTDADRALAHHIAESMGIDRGRPLIVAGSTGPGEEALLRAAIEPIENARLLCAPRRPERFDEAAAALPNCVRRSAPRFATGHRWLLLDALGELRAAYLLADLVVVGRTFAPMGGSDPAEPAGLGRAAVVGPSVENFSSVVAALDDAGGLVRTTRERLHDTIASLLSEAPRRQAVAEAAAACVDAQRGASRRHAEMLRELLTATGRDSARDRIA